MWKSIWIPILLNILRTININFLFPTYLNFIYLIERIQRCCSQASIIFCDNDYGLLFSNCRYRSYISNKSFFHNLKFVDNSWSKCNVQTYNIRNLGGNFLYVSFILLMPMSRLSNKGLRIRRLTVTWRYVSQKNFIS